MYIYIGADRKVYPGYIVAVYTVASIVAFDLSRVTCGLQRPVYVAQ